MMKSKRSWEDLEKNKDDDENLKISPKINRSSLWKEEQTEKDLKKNKDDDENLKNWINEALEKISTVCD